VALPVFGPLIAPLAISFFTFEFIHFIVEVRAGRIKEFSLKQFLVSRCSFRRWSAGPIKRYRTFAPQIDGLRVAQGAELQTALYRIVSGLFKKIAIADPVMVFALPIFHPDLSYTAGTYLVAMAAGSIKVYYDLSGYSDIAIGFGLLFGLRVRRISPSRTGRPTCSTSGSAGTCR